MIEGTVKLKENHSVVSFSISPSQYTVNASLLNTFNISVTNQNKTGNITQVNITLNSTSWAWSFIDGNNDTSAVNVVFSNTSLVLSWTNATKYGFIENETTEWFSFNLTVPSIIGTYTFNISIVDTSGT